MLLPYPSPIAKKKVNSNSLWISGIKYFLLVWQMQKSFLLVFPNLSKHKTSQSFSWLIWIQVNRSSSCSKIPKLSFQVKKSGRVAGSTQTRLWKMVQITYNTLRSFSCGKGYQRKNADKSREAQQPSLFWYWFLGDLVSAA